MNQQEEKKIIDRYLNNLLTGEELKYFMDKLESDELFRKKVSLHNLILNGIRFQENRDLEKKIVDFIGYKKPFIPAALKLIVVFLIITTGGIVLWNYLGPDSVRRNNFFALNFIRDSRMNKITVQADSVHTGNQAIKKSIPLPEKPISQQDSINKTGAESINDTSPAEEIVIMKDQMLISYTLKSIPVSENEIKVKNEVAVGKTDKSTSSESDPVNSGENYNIEFWVSPVNYKGYKLVNDRLILFGIEEPSAVQLYSGKDKLWMKYGKDFFSLVSSDKFEAFIETDEIPSLK